MKKEEVEKEYLENIEFENKCKKYAARFSEMSNFCQQRNPEYIELNAFYQGTQYLLKQYKNDKPWVVNINTPHAAVAIDKRVASLITNNYCGELFPLSPKDVEDVESLNKLLKSEWRRMGLDDIIDDCISRSAVVRESYIHIYYNKDKIYGGTDRLRKGCLEAYYLEPSTVFIDPTARSLKEADDMCVVERMSCEKALAKYPKLRENEKIFKNTNTSPQERGEIFVENDYTTEQNNLFTKKTFYVKNYKEIEVKEDGLKNIFKKKDKKTLCNIKRVVTVEDIIVEEEEMGIKNFPILQFRWKKSAQSCYGISLMDELLACQKAINSIESAMTNTAIAYAAPSIVIKKNSGLNPKRVAQTIGAPGVVYAVDGDVDRVMRPFTPPQIDDKIVNLKKDLEYSIIKVSGTESQFTGDIGSAGNTAGGTEQAIARATIVENKVLRNISEFVKDITEVITEYLLIMYADGTTKTFVETSSDTLGNVEFDTVKLPKSAKGLQFNTYINMVKRLPYTKEREKAKIMELFQIENQYKTDMKVLTMLDVINSLDLENEDEIKSRYLEILKATSGKKADTIQSLITIGTQTQVPPELMNQAITEIILNSEQTPTLDEILKMNEQSIQASLEQNMQVQQEADQEVENTSATLEQMGISPEALAQAQEIQNNQNTPML